MGGGGGGEGKTRCIVGDVQLEVNLQLRAEQPSHWMEERLAVTFHRHLSTLRICIRTSFISEKQWGFYQNQVYQTHFCSRLQTLCSTAITRITLHCKQLIVAGRGGGGRLVFKRRRELGRQERQNNTVLIGLSQERMLRLLGTAECVPVLPMPLSPWVKADDKCARRSRWKILQAHYANDRCPKQLYRVSVVVVKG